MAQIVICGYMIRLPLAGNVLAFAQYVLGFERLGHSVLYVEESGWPQACYDPASASYSDDPRTGMKVVRTTLAAVGATCELAYFDTVNKRTLGMDRACVDRQITEADLVLNLGGVCWLPAFETAQRLALVDMDPLFTQVGKFAEGRLEQYDVHFTYGTNIGHGNCEVPTRGIEWQYLVPPTIPELWRPPANASSGDEMRFTTIANWSAYGDVQWNGTSYGQKDRQFLELIELPRHTDAMLELAVTGMPSRVAAQFREAGWRLMDAAAVSRSFHDYRSYIWNSAGEFSVAKHGYVRSRAGWISDRTVCYLAAGKPAVVQDTGVPAYLSEREGWMVFSDLRGAAKALNAIMNDYAAAQRHARILAEEAFSYRRVLPQLLEQALSVAAR